MPAAAQKKGDDSKSYNLKFAPDVWFNSTDGVRLGVRMRGKEPGTLKEGPNRLDVGLWLGTFIPKYPVSYYVSYTEPIQSISGFNSEGSIGLRSSFRTGYQRHAIIFKKRWQPGFNAKDNRELAVSFQADKRFDDEYLLYPQIWQNDWLYIGKIDFAIANGNPVGRYHINFSTTANLAGHYNRFINTTLDAQQYIPIGDYFAFRGRIFVGLSSNNTAPEYLFTHSMQPYVDWLHLGLTRARGTIPVAWMHEGIIQVEGGANLRGYNKQDIRQLDRGAMPVYTSMGALNIEFDYPNPIEQTLNNISFVGDLLKFKSYLFFDTGTSLGLTSREANGVFSDAGPGFELSLNIPDYLGKSRGFAIRYDIPLWLSNPMTGEPKFKYRSLLGIGAVISIAL
jgi:hypothetical protein